MALWVTGGVSVLPGLTLRSCKRFAQSEMGRRCILGAVNVDLIEAREWGVTVLKRRLCCAPRYPDDSSKKPDDRTICCRA